MKKINGLLLILFLLPVIAIARQSAGNIRIENTNTSENSNKLYISATLSLDSVTLGANDQVVVTPALQVPGGEYQVLPSVMIAGRNMYYQYERRGLSKELRRKYSDIEKVVRRYNGKPQSFEYSANLNMEAWMRNPNARLSIVIDTCGCGHLYGSEIAQTVPLRRRPNLRLAYITPAVTPQPVAIHEGKAKVQFEVDRTELHTEPYRTKKGQLIDNVAQLKMIDDTVSYALSDPNVEIAGIQVCGYASPESPYAHNDYLATGRSRALAEYLAERYSLPSEKSTYSAVPENWTGFRKQTLESDEITEAQRQLLLQLIDAPTYGPADYDRKETTLKTDSRYKKLYYDLVLPKWFPELRVTHFAISTQLKPMEDEQLAEIILTNPEMLSLNQMFRVARLYAEGTEEFNRTIETALKYYPSDPVASLNAAVVAILNNDLDRAGELLKNAGNSPEAENARGVLAAEKNDYETAAEHFRNAGRLSEAVNNLKQIGQ